MAKFSIIKKNIYNFIRPRKNQTKKTKAKDKIIYTLTLVVQQTRYLCYPQSRHCQNHSNQRQKKVRHRIRLLGVPVVTPLALHPNPIECRNKQIIIIPLKPGPWSPMGYRVKLVACNLSYQTSQILQSVEINRLSSSR